MIKFVSGCYASKAAQIYEQYDYASGCFTANVGAEKIAAVFRHFIRQQKETPLFFVLELPTNVKDEDKLRTDDNSPFHIDVYYIDGLDDKAAVWLLDEYGELLINDGMSRFGFGCHEKPDELMLSNYNKMLLWTKEPEAYTGFFEAHNIPRVEKCITAGSSLTPETPGVCKMVERNGLSVYDLPDKLKDMGIYLAQRREDA